MKTFFWFCFALLIPGLLLRIPVGGAGILATDIILPIFGAVWLFQKICVQREFPQNRYIRPGLIFGCVAFLSFLLGSFELLFKEQILSLAYLIRFFALLIFGWAATDLFVSEEERALFFRRVFQIVTVIIVLGFLQFFFIPDISSWSVEGGWDPHTGRLLGTWMDPNFVAGFLGFLLPVIFAALYRSSTSSTRLKLLLLVAIALLALFLTFSRSGYLSAAIGMGLFFLLRDPKIIMVGIILATVGVSVNERAQKRVTQLAGTVSAIVLQNTDEVDPTASLRIQSWTRSLELWQKYPMLGIGYNTYRYRAAEEGIVDENYFSSGGSDSSHLTILVTTGVIGALVFLYFFMKLVLTGLVRYFRTKNEYFLGQSAGLTALFFHAFFVNSLLFPFLFMTFFSIASVLENTENE